MSDVSSVMPTMGFQRASHGGLSAALLRGWRPVHAWSARRRLFVALALGLLAALLTAFACVTMDAGGAQSAHVILNDAQARLATAHQTLARLPELRRDARDWPQRSHNGTVADDMRQVSQLAAQAGLALIALEPAAPGGAKAQAFRATKLMAQGGFAQLRVFLDGLAGLPELAVPTELSLKRGASGLTISALLQVFDGLPAVAFSDDADESSAADPFSDRFGSSQSAKGEGTLRLAGMLVERGRAVALIETAEGTTAVQAGTMLAGARVVEVSPARVVLAADGATQTLAWPKETR
ncbi:hypothetical protein [Paraburkholderia bannensis]|uniref:hypothetical protein n=1 Tax=Paraburkholderia bannensis TaxID=765414 RepID=UPI002AB7E7EE|nr:hypothetical protein [Paraburkholderia bannensis]